MNQDGEHSRTEPPRGTTPPNAPRKPKQGLLPRLRGYFLAGVLVTAPLAITVTVALWIIEYIDGAITPLIPDRYNPDTYLRDSFGVEFGIPGLGVLVLVAAVTLIGAFTAGLVGRWVVRFGEKLLDRMPVIRSLYKLIKQIFETVLRNKSDAFRQAVLVEYPRKGLWAIAFVTANTQGEIRRKLDREHVNIFLPTTPNPTSGFLLFVPRDDIIVLDMPVEDSVKLVISAGIVAPRYAPDAPAAQDADTDTDPSGLKPAPAAAVSPKTD